MKTKATTVKPAVTTTFDINPALWKRAEAAAKKCGQTVDEFTREAVMEKMAETKINKTALKKLAKEYGRLPEVPELAKGEFTIFDGDGDRSPGWVRLTCNEKTGKLFFNGKPITDRNAFLMWFYYATIVPAGLSLAQGEVLFEVFADSFGGAR